MFAKSLPTDYDAYDEDIAIIEGSIFQNYISVEKISDTKIILKCWTYFYPKDNRHNFFRVLLAIILDFKLILRHIEP
jgi:hypothetical protein